MLFRSAPRWPAHTMLEIEGREVEVKVRVSARARAYRLALRPHLGPVLTVPRHGRWAEAEGFLGRHAGWLAQRLKAQPLPSPFAPGGLVPLRGVPHRIVSTGALRGRIERIEGEEPSLRIPGDPEHLPRRLTDWLKREAAADLRLRSAFHAERLGVEFSALSVRSQSSRWGSCSSTGRLSFNWRLILAPPHVLDYVAAHEVAHLLEMNHSSRFWRTVERTLPEMERGRSWLKRHGSALMAAGR